MVLGGHCLLRWVLRRCEGYVNFNLLEAFIIWWLWGSFSYECRFLFVGHALFRSRGGGSVGLSSGKIPPSGGQSSESGPFSRLYVKANGVTGCFNGSYKKWVLCSDVFSCGVVH